MPSRVSSVFEKAQNSAEETLDRGTAIEFPHLPVKCNSNSTACPLPHDHTRSSPLPHVVQSNSPPRTDTSEKCLHQAGRVVPLASPPVRGRRDGSVCAASHPRHVFHKLPTAACGGRAPIGFLFPISLFPLSLFPLSRRGPPPSQRLIPFSVWCSKGVIRQ